MEQSILTSTKKVLGIGPDDTSFDLDILTYINSAFSNLHQLGIGPTNGFAIEDASSQWEDFGVTSLPTIGLLKTCIFLRVRMLFDPPTTSYHISAMKEQIQEHDWRLSQAREAVEWVDPDPPSDPDLSDPFDGVIEVVDGGGA